MNQAQAYGRCARLDSFNTTVMEGSCKSTEVLTMNTPFAELAQRVELLKEEIRYCPENLDDVARELIALFEFQSKLVEAEWEAPGT